MKIFTTVGELDAHAARALAVSGDTVAVKDEALLASEWTDALAATAVFGAPEVRDRARWLIRAAAYAVGVKPASIHALYVARARKEWSREMTVPAMNLRGPTYDVARAAFRAAGARKVGAFIFEIARSEIGYTDQRPAEYAAAVTAAGLREGFRGPLFLQGDHYQFSPSKYPQNPDGEKKAIRALIDESLAAGFRNIDIDASTLVNLTPTNVREQQTLNARLSAEMCIYIRERQPKGVTVSVGGEIGEVGKHNSNALELEAYMDLYVGALRQSGRGPGPSKVSVNTGSAHGGKVGADGKPMAMEIDFNVLRVLSNTAREKYGMAGAVQHGASTLPDASFHKIPPTGACEIHLATGFQNLLFDHPAFPKELHERIAKWVHENLADEKKATDTDEQFVYKSRKKAFGPFKRDLWSLPPAARDAIMHDMEAKFGFLFDQLGVADSEELAARYAMNDSVPPHPVAIVEAKGTAMAAHEGE